MLLPEPDSPTRANVSPRCTVNANACTACRQASPVSITTSRSCTLSMVASGCLSGSCVDSAAVAEASVVAEVGLAAVAESDAVEITAPVWGALFFVKRLKRLGRNILERGSNASRTASANKLAANTKASIKINAASRFHQIIGSRDISKRDFSIIEPKEFILGSTPIPR